MPYGLYVSADGAHAQGKRLEVIANNLANVDTAGFKRQLAIFQARYAEAVEQGQQPPDSGAIEDVGGGIFVLQTSTDFSPGPLKRTGIPTDMAIDGEGFFLVEKDGERLLTRAGNFRLTERGQLVTQQGYQVLNDAGEPIVLDRANGKWVLTRSGTIRQRGIVQNLAMVEPDSPGDLVRAGENLFRPLAEPRPLEPGRRRVVGGYLESSGVRPTTEMIDLIEASRAVEANINMMQMQNEMLAGLVDRLMRIA